MRRFMALANKIIAFQARAMVGAVAQSKPITKTLKNARLNARAINAIRQASVLLAHSSAQTVKAIARAPRPTNA